ncbi:hypothetical protein [Terrarubrum flagellatum]|uniref:hypothetical protein n=1 Tax=Terrirubrum flagellatum TaxID=2895980 RepID=UPI003145492C
MTEEAVDETARFNATQQGWRKAGRAVAASGAGLAALALCGAWAGFLGWAAWRLFEAIAG